MDQEAVLALLQNAGYPAVSLSVITEGSNHHVFDVTLENGTQVICKFAKVRETEKGITEAHLDTLFGGRLSLDRESYLLGLARQQGGLPVLPEKVPLHLLHGEAPSTLNSCLFYHRTPALSMRKIMRAASEIPEFPLDISQGKTYNFTMCVLRTARCLFRR